MADAWDGRPLNPERSGWFWVLNREGARSTGYWDARFQGWCGNDAMENMACTIPPEEMVRYADTIEPCHTPAEVTALVEAAGEQMRERAALWCADAAADAFLPPDQGGQGNVVRADILEDAREAISATPLPTPSLSAIRAAARREGMEKAARIAFDEVNACREDADTDLRSVRDRVEAAIRAEMGDGE